MKKIITSICLAILSTVLFAQGYAETKNGYVDPKTEFERTEKIEQEKTKTQIINVPEGFTAFKNRKYMPDEIVSSGGTIKIEYSPLYDEVRVYYTCMMVQYDKAEAMNTVLAVLQDFLTLTEYTNAEGTSCAKERYYHYKYLQRDKEKYFKNERGFGMAQYISYLKFTK